MPTLTNIKSNYMKSTKYIFGVLFTCFCINLSAQQLNKIILDSIISQSNRTNSNALIVYQNGKLVYKNYFGKPLQNI